uniref:NucA/NucB deoxyribonuclease domain-containing protein n=1 Tax=Rhodococcus sp. O3 TaxID=3404919 RepID=UPI003B67CD23
QAQTNRNNTCNRVKELRPAGKDCDEYPFASTYQGGSVPGTRTWEGSEVALPNIPVLDPADPDNLGAPGTSMSYISSRSNRSGGGVLNWFYRKNRILDNERFYVRGS